MTITPLANHISLRQTLNDVVSSKGVGGIRKMFKQTRSSPRKPRRKCAAKTEARNKESVDDFRVRRDEEIPDERYLEVVEEMLKRRENNGRDRDELSRWNDDGGLNPAVVPPTDI